MLVWSILTHKFINHNLLIIEVLFLNCFSKIKFLSFLLTLNIKLLYLCYEMTYTYDSLYFDMSRCKLGKFVPVQSKRAHIYIMT